MESIPAQTRGRVQAFASSRELVLQNAEGRVPNNPGECYETMRLPCMGLEIQNSRFLKMGHFQVSGDSRHLQKILLYGTLEIENGFEQLHGGGRCLELHAQGTMSVRMLFGRVTTGPTAAFHNTENAAPTFIRIHLPANDNLVDKRLCSNQQKFAYNTYAV